MNDWLDTDQPARESWPEKQLPKPADATMPGMPAQQFAAATTAVEKRAQFIVAWEGLTDKQRVFLNTWRECRFNANKAFRILANTANHCSKTAVSKWGESEGFELVRTMMRAASVEEILNRDHLAARQDDIVEELLTPKPILHQGEHTGFEEVQAGAASKANEVLLRLGGHLKDKDIEVNVGIVGPSFQIQVVQPTGSIIDVTPRNVAIELPEPDWVDE